MMDIYMVVEILYNLLSAYVIAVYNAILGVATAPTIVELLSRTLGLLILLLPAVIVYVVSQVAKYLLLAIGLLVTGLVTVRLIMLAFGF
jgi:hypothetical protein